MPSPEQPPRRPAGPRRNHSSQSHVSQSPPDGLHHTQQHPKQQHKPQRHVVGHGRLSQRNPSYGKGLNKAAAQRPPPPTGDGTAHARHHHHGQHHQRVFSTGSTTNIAPADTQAARPGLRRNASAAVVPRNISSHTLLKKNHSSSHLPRQMPTKTVHKHRTSTGADPDPLKRASKQRSRHGEPEVAPAPAPAHPANVTSVAGDDDNEWTEESAPQSPITTRTHTRQNSAVIEAHIQVVAAPQQQQQQQQQSDDDTSESTETDASQPAAPSIVRNKAQPAPKSSQMNGMSPPQLHAPNVPDADMITSRMLQRSVSQRLTPQVSDVSATAFSDSHGMRILSNRGGSAVIDSSSSKQAVSRFTDGSGPFSTPRESSIVPQHPESYDGCLTLDKRNKSAPNVSEADESALHRRQISSGTATPTNLHPSRTQQKLWLQRASSNMEPQQRDYHSSGEVVIDRELLRRFDEAASGFKVVRRFRNPVADAIARLTESPWSARHKYRPATPAKPSAAHTQRTPVSFDVHSPDGSPQDRAATERDEIEELCRKIWDRNELPEGE